MNLPHLSPAWARRAQPMSPGAHKASGAAGLLLALVVCAAAMAQGPERPVEGSGAPERADPRERWSKLTPAEKKRLEALHAALHQLDPAKRADLVERLKAAGPTERREILKQAKAALERSPEDREIERGRRGIVRSQIEQLPPEERRRFRQMSPEERQAYLTERLAARRKRVLEGLPAEERARVERLPVREQLQVLERLRTDRLFAATFQDATELETLRKQPRRKVLPALRSSLRDSNPSRPEWISEPTWNRWLKLGPRDRALVLRRLYPPPAPHPPPPSRDRGIEQQRPGDRKDERPRPPLPPGGTSRP